MKKTLIIVLAVALVFSLAACAAKKPAPAESMREYYEGIYGELLQTTFPDLMQFDYKGLCDAAGFVAVVTPLDELTAENSFEAGVGGILTERRSVREVRVVECYKDDLELGRTFKMIEFCGLDEDGALRMQENYYPMRKGDKYLVFLGGSGYEYPAAISGDNGKFDLARLSLNTHKEVLLDALSDLGLAETGGSDELLAKAADSIELLFGDLDEVKELVAQGGKWYPTWKLYALSDYTADLGQAEKDEILRRTAEWDSFTLTTKYTDKAYAIRIAYSDEGEGKIYRTDRFKVRIDPEDGMIFYMDGTFLA
ncbi:MAG: hypothetical protein IKX41_06315 [Oscillospiraceae bacterium]|nr:hypothetical protein [Oscillospiraceae bacterium]